MMRSSTSIIFLLIAGIVALSARFGPYYRVPKRTVTANVVLIK